MALVKASRKNVDVVKTVSEPRIVLELTDGAADFLLAVTSLIAGDPDLSPRKYAVALCVEMRNIMGLAFDETDAYLLMDPGYEAGIRCINYPDADGHP